MTQGFSLGSAYSRLLFRSMTLIDPDSNYAGTYFHTRTTNHELPITSRFSLLISDLSLITSHRSAPLGAS
jgi:hypothetical protein